MSLENDDSLGNDDDDPDISQISSSMLSKPLVKRLFPINYGLPNDGFKSTTNYVMIMMMILVISMMTRK